MVTVSRYVAHHCKKKACNGVWCPCCCMQTHYNGDTQVMRQGECLVLISYCGYCFWFQVIQLFHLISLIFSDILVCLFDGRRLTILRHKYFLYVKHNILLFTVQDWSSKEIVFRNVVCQTLDSRKEISNILLQSLFVKKIITVTKRLYNNFLSSSSNRSILFPLEWKCCWKRVRGKKKK
jgi:hypothetical protein